MYITAVVIHIRLFLSFNALQNLFRCKIYLKRNQNDCDSSFVLNETPSLVPNYEVYWTLKGTANIHFFFPFYRKMECLGLYRKLNPMLGCSQTVLIVETNHFHPTLAIWHLCYLWKMKNLLITRLELSCATELRIMIVKVTVKLRATIP